MGFLSSLMDATPGVGTLKAGYHYLRGEKEKGHEALYQSTRTTSVIAGGIFGGPGGAIAAGTATDAAASLLMDEEKGVVNSCKNIHDDLANDRDPTESIAYATIQIGLDSISGYGSSSGGVSNASKSALGKAAQRGGSEVIQKSARMTSAEVARMVGRKTTERAATSAGRGLFASAHIGLSAAQRAKREENERRKRELEERDWRRERKREERERKEREREEREWGEEQREWEWREEQQREREWREEQEQREREWREEQREWEWREEQRKWRDWDEWDEREWREREWRDRRDEELREEERRARERRELEQREREQRELMETVRVWREWFDTLTGENTDRETEQQNSKKQAQSKKKQQQKKKQEDSKKTEQRASGQKQDSSGPRSASSQQPEDNKGNGKKGKKRKIDMKLFEAFMALLKRILIMVYGDKSEPFTSIFEGLEPGQIGYLIKVLIPLIKFGSLEAVVELVVKMFKQLPDRDSSFLNFLSLLEFVQTYISDELQELTLVSSGTEETKTDPKERRAKILAEIVNEKGIVEKLINLFDSLKIEILTESKLWVPELPKFRDIYSAVYHYYKHRKCPHDGRILTVNEYYYWITLFLNEIKQIGKLAEMKNSKIQDYVHEVFVPMFRRRFRAVCRVFDDEVVLSSAYVVTKIHDDDKEKHAILIVAEVFTAIFMAVSLFFVFKNVLFYGLLLLFNTPLIVFNCVAFTVNMLLNIPLVIFNCIAFTVGLLFNTLLFFIACIFFILKVLFNVLLIFMLVWFLFYHLPDQR